MNWCFTSNSYPIVDLVTAVDQVFEVLMIALICSFVQILKHITGKLISAHFERPCMIIFMDSICTHVDHVATRLEVTVVTCNMKRGKLVVVLQV